MYTKCVNFTKVSFFISQNFQLLLYKSRNKFPCSSYFLYIFVVAKMFLVFFSFILFSIFCVSRSSFLLRINYFLLIDISVMFSFYSFASLFLFLMFLSFLLIFLPPITPFSLLYFLSSAFSICNNPFCLL